MATYIGVLNFIDSYGSAKTLSISKPTEEAIVQWAKEEANRIIGGSRDSKDFNLSIGEATVTYELKREWNMYPTGETKKVVKAKTPDLDF